MQIIKSWHHNTFSCASDPLIPACYIQVRIQHQKVDVGSTSRIVQHANAFDQTSHCRCNQQHTDFGNMLKPSMGWNPRHAASCGRMHISRFQWSPKISKGFGNLFPKWIHEESWKQLHMPWPSFHGVFPRLSPCSHGACHPGAGFQVTHIGLAGCLQDGHAAISPHHLGEKRQKRQFFQVISPDSGEIRRKPFCEKIPEAGVNPREFV